MTQNDRSLTWPGDDPDPNPTSAADVSDPDTTHVAGSRLHGHRLVWLVAGVAVVALAAGVGLSTLVKSPADHAAEASAPSAGPITAPVERKTLANDVTLRTDAVYEDAADVTIAAGDLGGAAVVTGQVPKTGAELNAASVALEVVGRPVIVLPGELPAYRTLRDGVSGPDVAQLKEALRAIGINPGGGKADVYDSATAAAVRQLYAKVGYSAPSAGEDADSAVKSAQETVTSQQDALNQARAALTESQKGPTEVEVLEADVKVRDAERKLAEARASGESVAAMQDELTLAQASRRALDAPKDTSKESLAITSARTSLEQAKKALSDAQAHAMTPFPVSEALYLSGLPRRVDSVNVKRGATLATEAAMTVSGATLQLKGSVPEAEAKLLTVGAAATVTLPDDSQVAATVSAVDLKKADEDADKPKDKGGTRYTVLLTPTGLTPDQVTLVRGENVRTEIPVESTDGDVLAVPIAALSAGPGGEARVDVRRGTATHTVTVTTGLVADGFAEITSADGPLDVGDAVVVGS